MDEHGEAEQRTRRDPEPAIAGFGRPQREERRPGKPREEQRVGPTERRVQDRDRRCRRQQNDTGPGGGAAQEPAAEQRDSRKGQASEDERRDAEGRDSGPPAEQDLDQPEVQRPPAALRGDDVKDVPEREIAEAKRQLLVDVQRRPPDGRQREPREKCRRDRRRGGESDLPSQSA